MVNVKFVYAQKSDVAEILWFIKELARYEKMEDEVVATQEGIVNAMFEGGKNIKAFFAEVDGKKVGFALYFYTFSTFLGGCGIYVEDLYVLPNFRGKGIGKKILAFIAQIAVEEKCNRMELTCLNWNVNSVEFYKSLGMKQMSEWTVHRLERENIEKLAGKK